MEVERPNERDLTFAAPAMKYALGASIWSSLHRQLQRTGSMHPDLEPSPVPYLSPCRPRFSTSEDGRWASQGLSTLLP